VTAPVPQNLVDLGIFRNFAILTIWLHLFSLGTAAGNWLELVVRFGLPFFILLSSCAHWYRLVGIPRRSRVSNRWNCGILLLASFSGFERRKEENQHSCAIYSADFSSGYCVQSPNMSFLDPKTFEKGGQWAWYHRDANVKGNTTS
jgi:hypothetical protein